MKNSRRRQLEMNEGRMYGYASYAL